MYSKHFIGRRDAKDDEPGRRYKIQNVSRLRCSWGVLDRLLEEPTLDIEAISGTSAGAMNGALLAYGLMIGGPDAAKKSLHEFWRSVNESGDSGCSILPATYGTGRW
ncbi:MAG TPA: patatin-like phospholipase family protein [Burkholderiales bacterium]|nr:patatin-like phospholipase family protein [Burkholderiales bacterium]